MYIWDDIYLKETWQTYSQIEILWPATYYLKNRKLFYYPNRQTGGNSKQRKLFFFLIKNFFPEIEEEREASIVCLSKVCPLIPPLHHLCIHRLCTGCENSREWTEIHPIVILHWVITKNLLALPWLLLGHFYRHLKLTLPNWDSTLRTGVM